MGINEDSNAQANKVEEARSSGDDWPSDERRDAGSLDEERIRERAYSIWIEEGQPEGRDVDHWLRAREELQRKAA